MTAGLVMYYTFDEGNVSDKSGNRANGVLINSPEFVSQTPNGKGKALFLNSIGEQFVNIPYNPFKNLEKYTASLWVKDFGQGLLFSVVSAYNEECSPYLWADSDSKFLFCVGNANYPGESFSYAYRPLQDGKWHLLSVVCEKTGYGRATASLYIDGSLTDVLNKPFMLSTGTKIQLGGNRDGRTKPFAASMKVDNIRFYNRALSAEEIEMIYDYEK